MAEPVGALRVDLSANAAQFEKDMGRARNAVRKSTGDMSKSFTQWRNRVRESAKSLFTLRNAIIGLAGATAIGLLIKRQVEVADAIGKTADRIGIGVEAFQELRHAAEITGIEMELFNTAMTALVRRAGEAINGNKEFAKGFTTLGISIEELRNLQPDELMGRVADGMKEIGNQSEQIAALDRVMSEAGRRMFNFANLGSAGIAKLRQEARDLGIVLGEDMVREAERANDQLTRMFNVLQTQLTRVVVSLSPEIVRLGEAFAAVVPDIIEFANQFLPDKFLPSAAIKQRIDEIESEIQRLTNLPKFSLERLLSADIGEIVSGDMPARTKGQIEELRAEAMRLNETLEERRRKEALLTGTLEQSGSAHAEYAAKVAGIRKGLEFELDQLGRTEEGQKLYNLAQKEGVEVTGEFIDRVLPLVRALEQQEAAQKKSADLIQEGKDATKALRTEQEVYNDEVQRYTDLLNAGVISQETFNRGIEQSAKKLQDAKEKTEKVSDVARDLGMTFSSAFEDAAISGGELSDVLQGLEQDLLRLALRRFATQPLMGAFDSLLGSINPFSFGSGAGANAAALPANMPAPFADGGFHKGGWRLVGERGPELEYTGPSRIFSNDDTRGMLGGGGDVTVNVYAPPGSSVETRESAGPGGRTFDIVLDEAMAKNIGTPGSRTGRALTARFGSQPQLQGR